MPAAPHAPYLEDTDKRLGEVMEGAAPHLHVFKVELPAEELHPQQGEDDDEEEEEEEQGGDGADRV